MKRSLLFFLAGVACAQYTTVPTTHYPALESVLNAKLTFQTGTSTPAGACTPGKDVFTDTSAKIMYWCDSSAHWVALIDTGGSYSNPAWITALAYTKITGVPTFPVASGATTHQFFTAYNSTTGAFTKAQPACADLSDAGAGCTGSGAGSGDMLKATYDPASKNAQLLATSDIDIDSTMAANSDAKVASQKAVKTALATKAASGATITINGTSCALSNSCTVADSTKLPTTIIPNTAPSAGQILAGNAGGTAFAPVSMSGDCAMANTGAIACTTLNSVAVAQTATASTIAKRNASGELIAANTVATGKTPMATDTAVLAAQLTAGSTIVAQKFSGTAAPGSVSGNLPGDLFTDTTAHHEYVCNAPSGTAAPACTSVTAAGWLQVDGGANYPGAGVPVSTGTAWGTSINPATIYDLSGTGLASTSTYAVPSPCMTGSVSYTALTAAATAQNVAVATVPAHWVPLAVQVEETTQFVGSGQITALGASVGTAAAPYNYLPQFALLAASNLSGSGYLAPPFAGISSTQALILRVEVTNANPGNFSSAALSAGSLTVRVCGVVLQ